MSILNLSDDSNTPVEDKIVNDDHLQTEQTNPEVQNASDDNPEQKVVVMDGPLSRIYTEALNMSLAKEAAAASSDTDILMVFPEDEVDQQTEQASDLYVYCCDAKDVDSEAAIIGSDKLRLALDNKKYKNVMMVMESHRDIGRSAGLLEEYAFSKGIKIVFKKDLAIETIKNYLK